MLLLSTLTGATYASSLVHNIIGYTLTEGDVLQGEAVEGKVNEIKVLRFVGLEFDAGKVTRLHLSTASLATSNAPKKIDGKGAIMLPGLIDAHGHLASYGRALSTVNLVAINSEAEALARVAAFAAAHKTVPWILGRGWNQVLWEQARFPTRASLDRLDDQRPIALNRIDGHAVWVNSAALRLAGIDNHGVDNQGIDNQGTTPDPTGGKIVRDATGRATGLLIDNAMQLVLDKIPPITDAAMAIYQLTGMQKLASFGLTAIHDAGISAQELRGLQRLGTSDRMPIRVYAMLELLDPDNLDHLAQGPLMAPNQKRRMAPDQKKLMAPDQKKLMAPDQKRLMTPDQKLIVRSVKIVADGALGSRGAALFADYADQPGQRGLLLQDEAQLLGDINRAMLAGYQVNVHAIGDRANALVLDYLAMASQGTNSRHLRHRIEHAQILRPEDISRFASSGILASIQPTHATSDKNMAATRLGEARLSGSYAWKTLMAAGARLAGGSDFPVESPNPFFGLHAAVTRQSQDNQPAGGWLPEEKLSRSVALSLFTEGPAYAAHQEHSLGRLLPGYEADFILVRDDYFLVPAEDIWKNQVLATYVAGQQVFASDAFSEVPSEATSEVP